MKKYVAMLLALIMLFSFAACGQKDAASTKEAATQPASAAEPADTAEPADAGEDEDTAYVLANGKLVVGITDFEPMDYQDETGKWIGFDAELAEAFAATLGVEVEFVEINWDSKLLELDGKNIDCIWNGMTLTDDVKATMETSQAYLNNAQIVVVNKSVADQYQTVEACADLQFAVESGSAGMYAADENNFSYTEVENQAGALMEVAAGTSDAAIIDSLMAGAMVGEGTGYADLTTTVKLTSEEYGVGFRKGSGLAKALDEFFNNNQDLVNELAEKYGVEAALIG